MVLIYALTIKTMSTTTFQSATNFIQPLPPPAAASPPCLACCCGYAAAVAAAPPSEPTCACESFFHGSYSTDRELLWHGDGLPAIFWAVSPIFGAIFAPGSSDLGELLRKRANGLHFLSLQHRIRAGATREAGQQVPLRLLLPP